MTEKVYVGIDPDVDKSGVGIWYPASRGITLDTMRFFKLQEFIVAWKETIKLVVIEAGWLNKGVWHGAENQGFGKASRIAKNVGSNHAVGRLIVEMCEHHGVPHELVKPTKKTAKLNAEEFKARTGYMRSTNPDKRDAFMLVHNRI